MSAAYSVVFEPPAAKPASATRAVANRKNAQHSTGPQTEAGKQRSSQNAISHGLTARTAVLPTEDLAAFEHHVQQFLNEYKPAAPTEDHLVHELANTSWRLKRIPLLEAEALSRTANPPNEQAAIDFDIVDAHRVLATLGLHGSRLSRQFHATLHELNRIQHERRERELREIKDAAALSELHKHKGVPYDPAHDGFVFSKEEIERYALRQKRLSEGRVVAHFTLYSPPSPFKPRLTTEDLAAHAIASHSAPLAPTLAGSRAWVSEPQR